ncbi:unnamed protein product [Caenorhabditis nigoni]
MSKRFPILRIPLVVLTEVVTQLDPAEIVSMSLCSRRSLNLLKANQLKSSRNWELQIIDQDDDRPGFPRVSIFLPDLFRQFLFTRICWLCDMLCAKSITDLKYENPQFVNIDSHRVPAVFEKGFLITYWKDRVQGMKVITDYTCSLFSIHVSSVTIFKSSLWMLDWVPQRQSEPLKNVNWWSAYRKNEEFWDDEVFSSAMRQCPTTERLYIISQPSVNYLSTEKFPKVNEISISNGGWVTIDNLMSIDSIEICIGDSHLPTQDIIKFLKHWLAGGMSRMEYIRIKSENLSELEFLTVELERHVVPNEEIRKYQKRVSMSLCSRRSLNFLKANQLKSSRNWELHMTDQDDEKPESPRVTIFLPDLFRQFLCTRVCWYLEVLSARSLSDLKSENPEFIKIGPHRVPVVFERGCWNTYWEDRVQGMKVITDYTCSLFSIHVSSVTIFKSSLWMLEWVSQRQSEPLKNVNWWSAYRKNENFWNDEEFSSAMRQCPPTESLYIIAQPSVNYRLNEKFPKVNEISISQGGWVTIDNLMSIDSIEMCIGESKLSTTNIIELVKHWLDGGMPRMEYIRIESNNLDELEFLTEEIEPFVVPIEVNRKYQKHYFGFEFEFVGGYSIRREDGVNATINFRHDSFHMAKWNV